MGPARGGVNGHEVVIARLNGVLLLQEVVVVGVVMLVVLVGGHVSNTILAMREGLVISNESLDVLVFFSFFGWW